MSTMIESVAPCSIGVIIPTYNGERFLAETIHSVLAQSYPPCEVIVVDDGSDDGTAALVAAFGHPVRMVSNPRGGPAGARNRGIEETRAEFIAFIDHDDLWHQDKLAKQMEAFDADPSLDVCVSRIQRFQQGASGNEIEFFGTPAAGYLTVTMLVRRESFKRVGPLNASLKYSDAAEWFLRARARGLKIRLLPEVLTFHRSHGSNFSEQGADQARSEFLHLARRQMSRSGSS